MQTTVQDINPDDIRGGGPTLDPLLTPLDVSELLGIPVKTLANWRSERVGPLPLRIGCHVRYRSSDVAAWIEERVDAARRRTT